MYVTKHKSVLEDMSHTNCSTLSGLSSPARIPKRSKVDPWLAFRLLLVCLAAFLFLLLRRLWRCRIRVFKKVVNWHGMGTAFNDQPKHGGKPPFLKIGIYKWGWKGKREFDVTDSQVTFSEIKIGNGSSSFAEVNTAPPLNWPFERPCVVTRRASWKGGHYKRSWIRYQS
jgi:hypothetical protein